MSGMSAIASSLIAGPTAEAITTAGEPAVGCEIAFTSTPNAEEPAYLDVSTDLRAFSYSRGKQRELDRYQAGRGSLTLINSNRRYDPSYTGAGDPYNGNIKPQKRVRIPVTYNGATHYLFEGFIDSWDQQRKGPHTSEVTVSFTDGFKVLSKRTLPRSVYTREVSLDSPIRWYRLDEAQSTSLVFDSVAGADGTLFGTPTFGTSGLIDRDSGTAMTVAGNGGTPAGVFLDTPIHGSAIPAGSDGFSVEFWIQCSEQTADDGVVFVQFPPAITGFVEVKVRETGAFVGLVQFRVGNLIGRLSNVRVDNGVRHHVVCVCDSAGGLTIYIDGVDRTDYSVGTNGTLPVVSAPAWIGGYTTGDAFSGIIDELAIYNTVLTATQISTHNSAGRTPWTGDTPAERLERVLDAVDWPQSRREIDTGTSVLQGADLGQSGLEHAQKVEGSEFGQLFISKAGVLRLVGRVDTTNKTPVATLTDDDDYQASDPEYTDELLKNSVTVSRAEGVAQLYEDQTSIDEFEINSYTTDGLFHNSDLLSRHAAEYIVNVSKDPLLRISSLTIMPKGNPQTLFPLLLALELGDWLTIEETPQDVGSAITHTAVVEGIMLDWSPKSWVFTVSLSPFGTDDVLELDAGSDNGGLDDARLFF